jgi:hypothetical protein
MRRKRIYKCLQNTVTGTVEISVTDEKGHSIITSVFGNLEETVAYFQEIKDELSKNEQLEVVEIDDFHFESQSLEKASNS